MTESRLLDYLDHIQQAAADACFIDGMSKEDFFSAVVGLNEMKSNTSSG